MARTKLRSAAALPPVANRVTALSWRRCHGRRSQLPAWSAIGHPPRHAPAGLRTPDDGTVRPSASHWNEPWSPDVAGAWDTSALAHGAEIWAAPDPAWRGINA